MSVFMTEEQRRIETGEEIKKLIRRYMTDVPMSVWETQTVKNIDKIGTITFFDNTEFTYIEKIISILLRDKDNNPFWGLTTEEKERLFCLLEKFGISCNNDDYNSVLSENKSILFGSDIRISGTWYQRITIICIKTPFKNHLRTTQSFTDVVYSCISNMGISKRYTIRF